MEFSRKHGHIKRQYKKLTTAKNKIMIQWQPRSSTRSEVFVAEMAFKLFKFIEIKLKINENK